MSDHHKHGHHRHHGYKKDMSNVSWAEVFQRQSERKDVILQWLQALPATTGLHVMDIGCGPGFISILAAQMVGPAGLVLAVDRSADALQYLAEEQERSATPNIKRIHADATTLDQWVLADVPEQRVDAVLLTNMLHHDDHPAEIIRRVRGLLAPGTPVIVAEFEPSAAGEFGPPLSERIRREQVTDWLQDAGFEVHKVWDQPMEQYAVRAVAR